MKMQHRLLAVLAVVWLMWAPGTVAFGQDQQVRWDLISVAFTTPLTVRAGGFADAIAPNNGGRIRLTGSGTFVASADQGRGANAVTGGGTWETFDPAGRGTYVVRELVRFELASPQTGPIIDNIGDPAERANGYAYLRVDYDDGNQGVLGVFCHGPGAPDGIAEGINATKGFVTYTEIQGPAPGIDANRTIFHVRQEAD